MEIFCGSAIVGVLVLGPILFFRMIHVEGVRQTVIQEAERLEAKNDEQLVFPLHEHETASEIYSGTAHKEMT